MFYGVSHPILAKNNAKKGFFNFLNFFAIFIRIFFPRSSMNGIRNEIFFPSFSAYLIPFWQKIMPERGFLIFWIFLLIFSQFASPSRVWTEFGTKCFLPNLIPYWLKIMLERDFLIFWFFLEFSCPDRVRTEFRTKFFFSLSWPISSRFG